MRAVSVHPFVVMRVNFEGYHFRILRLTSIRRPTSDVRRPTTALSWHVDSNVVRLELHVAHLHVATIAVDAKLRLLSS